MKTTKKTILLFFLISFILTPLSQIVMAEENGTGIKNELSDTNQKAYDTLPSDEELAESVKDSNANIGEASNKEIGKGKGKLYDAYKDEIDDYIKERKKQD